MVVRIIWTIFLSHILVIVGLPIYFFAAMWPIDNPADLGNKPEYLIVGNAFIICIGIALLIARSSSKSAPSAQYQDTFLTIGVYYIFVVLEIALLQYPLLEYTFFGFIPLCTLPQVWIVMGWASPLLTILSIGLASLFFIIPIAIPSVIVYLRKRKMAKGVSRTPSVS